MAGRNSPKKILEFFSRVGLYLFKSDGNEIEAAAEDDGTQRQQTILYDGTNQVRARAEATGEARVVPLVSDDQGTTLRYIDSETTGEVRIVPLGSDDAGTTLRYLRTLSDGTLVVDTQDTGSHVWVAPVRLTGVTPTTIYTCPASTIAIVTIHFAATTTTNLSLHRVPSGGSADATNALMTTYPVTANLPPAGVGPFTLHASGLISATAAIANNIVVHLTVQEIPT